jgi:hypothetical protein
MAQTFADCGPSPDRGSRGSPEIELGTGTLECVSLLSGCCQLSAYGELLIHPPLIADRVSAYLVPAKVATITKKEDHPCVHDCGLGNDPNRRMIMVIVHSTC